MFVHYHAFMQGFRVGSHSSTSHTCIRLRTLTYIHTCMHTYTHVYTYIHTHTYLQAVCGMHLFGDYAVTGGPGFADMRASMLTILQTFTGEGWPSLAESFSRRPPECVGLDCGWEGTTAYLLLCCVVTRVVVLPLFVASLIDVFMVAKGAVTTEFSASDVDTCIARCVTRPLCVCVCVCVCVCTCRVAFCSGMGHVHGESRGH
jgi:hypothetical protein